MLIFSIPFFLEMASPVASADPPQMELSEAVDGEIGGVRASVGASSPTEAAAPQSESDTTRFLAPHTETHVQQWIPQFGSVIRPFMANIVEVQRTDADASSAPHPVRHLRAADQNSACWVNRDNVAHCPLCEVELGVQHKNVTKRHCRHCGGLFCYTCTYDKVTLRHHPEGACFPWTTRLQEMHVCTRCALSRLWCSECNAVGPLYWCRYFPTESYAV